MKETNHLKPLWIWTGPVSAEKSTGALRIVKRLTRRRNKTDEPRKAILFRPIGSIREEESQKEARTKNGETYPCHEVSYCNNVLEHLESNVDYDILWFDELHFLEDEPNAFEMIQTLREKYLIVISGISAGNRMTPLGESFGKLLQVADEIHSEKADCDACPILNNITGLNAATRTVYIGEGTKHFTTLVGGPDLFRPVCPDCWNTLQPKSQADIREIFLNS